MFQDWSSRAACGGRFCRMARLQSFVGLCAGHEIMNLLDTLTGGYASLIKYGVLAAVIVGAFGYTYHLGGVHKEAVWSAKYEKREVEIAKATAAEISRQAQANAQAKAVEQQRIAELEAANQALEQLIKEKSDEADADPDRDRPALSSSAGMRIDAIH